MRGWRGWVKWARGGPHYPFTRADYLAWRGVQTCLAGEVRHAYGLSVYECDGLYRKGNDACAPLIGGIFCGLRAQGRVARVSATLDALEDMALEIKRARISE